LLYPLNQDGTGFIQAGSKLLAEQLACNPEYHHASPTFRERKPDFAAYAFNKGGGQSIKLIGDMNPSANE
jgi:hypothetical protein